MDVSPTAHEAAFGAAIDQADGALVTDLELLRELGHRRARSIGILNKKEKLVLSRGDAGAARRVLGKPKKAAESISKAGQVAVVAVLEVVNFGTAMGSTGSHRKWEYIVLRYKFQGNGLIFLKKENDMTRLGTVLSRVAAFFAASALVALAGCAKKPPATAEAAKPPEAAAQETRVLPPANTKPMAREPDVLSEDLQYLNSHGYLQDAFFDYDKADLREDARTTLAKDAEWLRKYPSTRLLIEGHCDERGTEEYNLALGDRRANATKEYLAAMGISDSRVQTVSFGKDRPFCTSENDQCWQENRRAHFLITAK